jgi:hypothetical protein
MRYLCVTIPLRFIPFHSRLIQSSPVKVRLAKQDGINAARPQHPPGSPQACC